MPYVNILDRNISYNYHRGVTRATYISQNEFMSLFDKVLLSGEILMERAEDARAKRWLNTLLLGQHENGQFFLHHSPLTHAYELRGRLIAHQT